MGETLRRLRCGVPRVSAKGRMTAMPEERPRRTPNRNGRERRRGPAGGMQLLAVQSVACVVILLIALLMRFIGGGAFDQLRQSFNQAMMDNSVINTLASLFGPLSGGDSSSPESGGEGDASEPSSQDVPSQGDASIPSGAVSVSDSSLGMGGQDLPVSGKRAFFAPEGATFAELKINLPAALPLDDGTVTSYFGYRENPTKGGEGFHQGLDIGAPEGSPIYSMYYGRVSAAGESASYGNYVKLDHGNGIEILYAHCSEVLVGQGVYVRAGETVAKVGTTGDSNGFHLHTEVRVNGLCYDPSFIIPLQKYHG